MTIGQLIAHFALPASAKLPEARIERIAESFFDRLDARFTRAGSTITQADYDAICAAFAKWEDACRAAH